MDGLLSIANGSLYGLLSVSLAKSLYILFSQLGNFVFETSPIRAADFVVLYPSYASTTACRFLRFAYCKNINIYYITATTTHASDENYGIKK